MQSFSDFLIRGGKNEITNEAPPPQLMRKKALRVLTAPCPSHPGSPVRSHNEGDEGVGQQMLGV